MAWSLADVLGQNATLARLNHEAASGRMAHAYLIEGPAGTGKLTLARGLAARLFCQNVPANGAACGICRPCHLLAHDNHPDYLELPRNPAELRLGRFVERPAAPGSADSIEHPPLLSFLRLKPSEGGWRVAVIPDAERMRPESANAFLKTLEEPPPQTLLILTATARDRLPATICSRCRRVGMLPLDRETIAGELAKRGLAEGGAARDLAEASEGSLGVAIGLSGGGTLALWRWLEREAFAQPGADGALRLAAAWQTFDAGPAGPGETESAGKRRHALKALDLTALALRRLLRRGGAGEDAVAGALNALWTGAEQIVRNVRPDLVLLSAALEIMAVLKARS